MQLVLLLTNGPPSDLYGFALAVHEHLAATAEQAEKTILMLNATRRHELEEEEREALDQLFADIQKAATTLRIPEY